ncbi:tetratricopeptide repeat protein [Luteolibacter sp. LG18]|uniref:tetratricopeptide repeat protein n=1 Tax=Luteolibacter sp. LG18 TaxID=2819286 RepID=UPI002B2B46F0|nr:hypothetical protein llg_39960 [Luteolibacter sp. LG18]
MTVRTSVLALLLTLPLAGAPALRDLQPWRQGLEALDAELWEVADTRFEEALQTRDLTPADRHQIEFKRLEAWIRGDRPAQALTKLSDPAFASDAETYFWKAQALAGLGRYREAVETLAPAEANPKAAFRNQALLTRANLQLSLGDQDGASATLDLLAKAGDAKLTRMVKLRQAAILIDRGKFAEARKLLPPAKTLEGADLAEQAFLDATLLLAEGRTDEATAAFTALKEQAETRSRSRYYAAVIGLADATAASDGPEAGALLLLDEIQKQKDAPMLDVIFKRILQWLPEHPIPADPVLERLKLWIPPKPAAFQGVIAASVEKDPAKDTSGAADAWPVAPEKTTQTATNDLAAFSLFTRAIGLRRQGTVDSAHEADFLMSRLRYEYPRHFLVPKALLEIGRWRLEDKQPEAAFAALNAVLQTANSPLLKGEAAFTAARAEYDQDHPEAATALFDQAAALLPNRAGDTAALNSALTRLQNGSLAAFPRSDSPERDARIRADLDLERALSDPSPEKSCEALQQFLSAHPDHPRAGEARLSAAIAALRMHPPDSAFSKAQVGMIEADPALSKSVPPERLAWLRLEIADQAESPADAIHVARQYLNSFSDSGKGPEATLILGRNLFRNEDYHNARLTLEKMAASAPNSPIAPAALMLAARSAALGATDQSREESLALYAKLIARNDALTPLARLERASLLNDLSRLDVAIAELQPWFNSMKPGDPLRIPAGLLLGDALYAQGVEKPASLATALTVYDQLLAEAKNQPALINRLQYQRGMTLERLPGPEGTTRAGSALECYVAVLQAADDHAPAEWKWFENCGFRALKLLEDAGKWRSAMKIASKIASFNGPRSAEAAERAKTIRMEQMIYED